MSITPKPWKQIGGSAMYNDVFGTARTQDAPPGWESWTPVCRVHKHQDGKANTQAIIALPDLLEAAEEAEKLLAALLELYGTGLQVHGWHLNGDPEPFDSFVDDNSDGTELANLRAAIAKAKGPLEHTGS